LRFGSAVDGTQAVQLGASGRELLAQFGHLILQPALRGDQFGAALADGVHENGRRVSGGIGTGEL
jgi:hypothetical protein